MAQRQQRPCNDRETAPLLGLHRSLNPTASVSVLRADMAPLVNSRIQGIQQDISPFALFSSCLIERPESAPKTNQKQIFPSAAPGTLHRLQRIRLTNNCHSGAILSYTGCHSTSPHSFSRRPALKPWPKANRAAPLAPSPQSQNLFALLGFQGCPTTHHFNRGINQRHQYNSARPWCRHWPMLT